MIRPDDKKSLNTIHYQILKKQKEFKAIQKLVDMEKEKLKQLQSTKGHYSVRNVEKRDLRAQKNRKELRQAKMTILNQNKAIAQYAMTVRKLKRTNRQLKNKLLLGNNDSDSVRRSILNSEEHVQQLLTENESLKDKLVDESANNTKKKHSLNYLKRSLNKLRMGMKSNDSVKKLQKIVSDKENEIQLLTANIETLQEKLENNFQTKNADGSFSENVRLCVIELAGLEVAVEKIPKVIQSISHHIFARKLDSSDLPSKSTTQTIVDEGHYIAKKFIATKIDTAESFGINRDGTTRKKQKILDTSVTLDSGEIMSLGFTRVAHETAKTINYVTKHHVQEMCEILTGETSEESNSEQYIRNTLEKLSFSMSDRASNEKAADRLLDEWRDSVIGNSPGTDVQKIKHFHCMAHVLLGFHKYACDDVKKLESRVAEKEGPLGRDSLEQFKTWAKTGTVVERVVRTVSDTFAPAGDHRGLRDRWEAHCSENGIKSVIGNYKDNRFNGIFQTSAEILHHANDMIEVLGTVHQPNRKLISVKADLQCQIVQTLLHCYGLFFLKVTGPYWNLITSGTVPYLQLYSHIQSLTDYLKTCASRPETLLNPDLQWESVDTADVQHGKLFENKVFSHPAKKELLLELVQVVSGAMVRCIEKQLQDFLPGGQFSEEPETKDLKRTGYSPSTNLGCEHHFGDLDSSQKRRPNATMHHHSSVQLLKRNRVQMLKWLSEMPQAERNGVFKQAKKGGKSLRKVHLESEKNVLKEIHSEMLTEKAKKSKKRKRQEIDLEIENDNEFENVISSANYNINEYVAVAYQDSWYPGVIERTCDDCLYVNFLTVTRRPGHFAWPARKDVQKVSLEFIIKRGFVPECKNSGRLWFIAEYEDINKLFTKYSHVYF